MSGDVRHAARSFTDGARVAASGREYFFPKTSFYMGSATCAWKDLAMVRIWVRGISLADKVDVGRGLPVHLVFLLCGTTQHVQCGPYVE